jgi:hypothetical protein
MATVITIDDLARNLPLFIARVETDQEHFLIREGDKTLAELGPAPTAFTAADLAKLFSTLPKLTDSKLTNFENDLAEFQKKQPINKGRNHDC